VATLGIADPPVDGALQREAFLGKFPVCRGKRLLLFLGRIHEKKGCDLLLSAFAKIASRFPDLLLVMAGPEQPGVSCWRELAGTLNIGERVLWTGMLSGDVKWGAMRAADAFVLPSHQENFGIAVAEALACGLPVLISREVNIWREIDEAHAGFVEPDDNAGTLRLLERWLDLSPAEQDAMRLRARECFVRSFEIGRAVDNLICLLRENQRRSGP
jgi:glycosyltransferase involved in cell wall biosynthesis